MNSKYIHLVTSYLSPSLMYVFSSTRLSLPHHTTRFSLIRSCCSYHIGGFPSLSLTNPSTFRTVWPSFLLGFSPWLDIFPPRVSLFWGILGLFYDCFNMLWLFVYITVFISIDKRLQKAHYRTQNSNDLWTSWESQPH